MSGYEITNLGYKIPKSTLSEDKQKSLMKQLTVKPLCLMEDYEYMIKEFPVYRVSKTNIYTPKFFGLETFGDAPHNEKPGDDIHIKFKGRLRPDQEKFIEDILSQINTVGSCIGCAETGQGKTVMAIDIITKIAKKTLIVVHKDFLLEQWKERIGHFCPDAKIGIIKQNKIEIDGKDIVIGMLQSISMKDYPEKTFDAFGFTIIDETHHICSHTFSKALYKIHSKKMLGLSATPDRKDGLTKVLHWFLGSVIKKEKIKNDIEKTLVQIIPAIYEEEIPLKYNKQGTLNIADLINKISMDPFRNSQIADIIIEKNSEGRKIIVLSERRNQCLIIKEILENKKFKGSIGLYLGLMKKDELDKSNKCDVILATYHIASEGYDNPVLDTLILATSKSDIHQSCGRILRQKNVNRPLIIDIADVEYRYNQIVKRKQFYRKHDYEIEDFISPKKSKVDDFIDDEPKNNGNKGSVEYDFLE